MNPKRKQRLLIILGLVAALGVAVGLVLYALSQNINLFFTPTQIADNQAPDSRIIRLGGMVAEGSVERDPESLEVSFEVTDFQNQVRVTYTGILPDLFREGQGVVVQGRVLNRQLQATEVLAKHDENYMPPEVTEALRQSGQLDKLKGMTQ
jgi:cytochrome c-type biogenesis protein CcmE|tara:strand:- start:23411 stop:23863 length:453 start_codon:yes stop_codon:yes gene_type:complete